MKKVTRFTHLPIEDSPEILKKFGLTIAWILLVEEYLKELLNEDKDSKKTLGQLISGLSESKVCPDKDVLDKFKKLSRSRNILVHTIIGKDKEGIIKISDVILEEKCDETKKIAIDLFNRIFYKINSPID